MWGKSEQEILGAAEKRLGEILGGVCASHGLEHALCVTQHTRGAIDAHNAAAASTPIDDDARVLLLLASLLHDADDHKFFAPPSHNAETVLAHCSGGQASAEEVAFVLKLIDFVSCSKNGDTIPPEAEAHPEYLFPRYSDRLEALGEVGVRRCYKYNAGVGAPLYCATTPRPRTVEELRGYATEERFRAYKGNSDSMLDHYFDKLLHLSRAIPDDNAYYARVKGERDQILVDILLHYGEHGTLHPYFDSLSQ